MQKILLMCIALLCSIGGAQKIAGKVTDDKGAFVLRPSETGGGYYRSLFGEMLNYGEETGTVQCSYAWKEWAAGVGMLYPFGLTSRTGGYKLLNKQHQSKSWTYIDDNARMLYFALSWKFSSGRRHQAGSKTMTNSDRDTGVAM